MQSSLSTALCLQTLLILLCIGMSLFSPSQAEAETLYVRPTSEAAVRTGQGTEFKILAMVKDGSTVEFIEENNSYTKVRLKNGVEGWMLKRFLKKEPPPTLLIETLREENRNLNEKAARSAEELAELSSTLERTKTELSTVVLEKNDINDNYQALLGDTADVMEIKRAQQKTAKENLTLTEQMTLVQQENETLKKDKTMHWFLAGAGVFLVGIFIGKLPTPSRRRKSSLLQ